MHVNLIYLGNKKCKIGGNIDVKISNRMGGRTECCLYVIGDTKEYIMPTSYEIYIIIH